MEISAAEMLYCSETRADSLSISHMHEMFCGARSDPPLSAAVVRFLLPRQPRITLSDVV